MKSPLRMGDGGAKCCTPTLYLKELRTARVIVWAIAIPSYTSITAANRSLRDRDRAWEKVVQQ
jgi:hypothetical protein